MVEIVVPHLSKEKVAAILDALPQPNSAIVSVYGFDPLGPIKQAAKLNPKINLDCLELKESPNFSVKKPSKKLLSELYAAGCDERDLPYNKSHSKRSEHNKEKGMSAYWERLKKAENTLHLVEVKWYRENFHAKLTPNEFEVTYTGSQPSWLREILQLKGKVKLEMSEVY